MWCNESRTLHLRSAAGGPRSTASLDADGRPAKALAFITLGDLPERYVFNGTSATARWIDLSYTPSCPMSAPAGRQRGSSGAIDGSSPVGCGSSEDGFRTNA